MCHKALVGILTAKIANKYFSDNTHLKCMRANVSKDKKKTYRLICIVININDKIR